ncbi:hypothetical protein [Clostridium sp. CF012]|uniref:hypothetical protein n=1 Tax=Clostridium sp. CF012 TaxID=2843319 RepID=UPI001C0DF74F|nr:hypothetical protein [Clostridium sp. CF012]MBU3142531.1 hypothetical protein [Clostridium sp. CF012]
MKTKLSISVIILILISIIITISSCAKNSKDTVLRIQDYFPKKGMIKKFSGGFENSGFTQIIDKINGNKFQIKQQDTATGVILIYQVSDTDIRLIFSKEEPEGKFKENYIGLVEPNANDIILKTPLEVGTRWTDASELKYEITGINVPVNAPAGSFSAIEVTSIRDTFKSKMYYAKDLGLVKRTIEGYSEDELIKID